MHPADENACAGSEFKCLCAESVVTGGILALLPWLSGA